MKIQINIDIENNQYLACTLFELSLRKILSSDESADKATEFVFEDREQYLFEQLTVEERRYFKKWFNN
jgi:hypothetical protein